MGKIIAFDNVTMRWLTESFASDTASGNTDTYAAPSEVFQSGYDDPTYLTFRVEFGNWGASTKDFNQNMESLHEQYGWGLGTKFRYDDLPMGLLDPNFAEQTIKERSFYAFNAQNTYNAYNYLLQRNEDTRATYIQNFIKGLYEIQYQYPYLFQSISGLDGLVNFEDSRGYRLKDAEIEIECLEGLSQKIRTLMELYKKAAWDDVYQRWILPENYRWFKMIIYVFERRTFHSMSQASAASSAGTDQESKPNFGSQVLNFLLSASSYQATSQRVSGQAAPMGPASYNADMPVRAYECYPCEFDINLKDPGSLSAAWNISEEFKTTIKIHVKNVKTYMTNRLTKQLSNMMVYDLASNVERSNPDMTGSTITGANQNFMSKGVILSNESMANEFRAGFGGGGDANSVSQAKKSWDTMVNNWKSLFGKGKSTTAGQPGAFQTNSAEASM